MSTKPKPPAIVDAATVAPAAPDESPTPRPGLYVARRRLVIGTTVIDAGEPFAATTAQLAKLRDDAYRAAT